ncbi:MAG TPA: DUF2098 family protein [Candidatus Bathyarchaeia archaeon]|nr:DUF2098 family protein [Candidatus Bathyarchaeia archaeon]
MSDVIAYDMKNQAISVGANVKYAGTHTRGKVREIRVAGDSTWVLIDSTNLYYDPKHLELVSKEMETADREAQSLEEFRRRLDQRRELLHATMEGFDEPGG